MSEASKRGRDFELKVAKIMHHKLKIAVERDKRSGAGWNKSDISDYWNELPLHVEIKDQQNIKIQEWFRQSDAAATFTKAPTVVFAVDEEILATLRFSDLLNFLVEIADLRVEVDDLRQPVYTIKPQPQMVNVLEVEAEVDDQGKMRMKSDRVKPDRNTQFCKEGHLADEYGYCQQRTCKYSRGYKKKKDKK